MIRFTTATAFCAILIAMFAVTGLSGCSSSGVTTPRAPLDVAPSSPTSDSLNMGHFQFVFGEDGSVKVEPVQTDRSGQFDVTAFAWVVIDDFYFEETERNWYVTATIKNISEYTGYDVLVVFHSLGAKYVTNQDGFIWGLPPIFPEPTRLAFLAYGKNQEDRNYPSMFSDSRTVVIHQPEGTPQLAPIGFWIDATINPRKTPGVEDLNVTEIDSTNYQLTGYVWDHQSPSSSLTVYADCTNFNGDGNVPMYDDGLHGDGDADDSIFGCTFSGDPAPDYYTITVYAFDPLNEQGENDVMFNHGVVEPPPCYDFTYVAGGTTQDCHDDSSQLITTQEDWEYYWETCHPDLEMPQLGFGYGYGVYVINLGPRPTTKYLVYVDDVCESTTDPDTIVVNWTEYEPADDCEVENVTTYPWRVIRFFMIDGMEYTDSGTVEIYECGGPPPCTDVPFEELADGEHSCAAAGNYGFQNQTEYEAFWSDLYCDIDVPQLPADPEPVDGGIIYHFGIQVPEINNTGFYVTIDDVCYNECTVTVKYVKHYPGSNCQTLPTKIQPWVVGAVELPDNSCEWTWNFEHSYAPEECPELNCYDFSNVMYGNETDCHDAFTILFETAEEFDEYWAECHDGVDEPFVDFENGMGAFGVHLGERPTTGYWPYIYAICDSEDPYGVLIQWVEWTPGWFCDVEQVTTYPWRVVKFQLVDKTYYVSGIEEMLWCPY